MNIVAQNILSSLVGNWCLCDVETTALKPNEGALISVGFLPFTIIQNPTGSIEISLSSQHPVQEVWFFSVRDHMELVKSEHKTMEWHKKKNPAFSMYHDAYKESLTPAYITRHITEMFKNHNYNFLSRHSFDSKWLEVHWPDVFESIHYRNFYDIASMFLGMGFQDEKLYREIQKEAKIEAAHMQNRLAFDIVPISNLYVEHRPLTDMLIDYNMLKIAIKFIENNAGLALA